MTVFGLFDEERLHREGWNAVGGYTSRDRPSYWVAATWYGSEQPDRERQQFCTGQEAAVLGAFAELIGATVRTVVTGRVVPLRGPALQLYQALLLVDQAAAVRQWMAREKQDFTRAVLRYVPERHRASVAEALLNAPSRLPPPPPERDDSAPTGDEEDRRLADLGEVKSLTGLLNHARRLLDDVAALPKRDDVELSEDALELIASVVTFLKRLDKEGFHG